MTVENETAEGGSDGGNEREAMLEAYKAELAGQSVDDAESADEALAKHDPNAKMRRDLEAIGALDDDPAKEAPTAEAKQEDEDVDPDEVNLAKALRQREKLQAKRREAMAEVDNMRSEIEREKQQLAAYHRSLKAQADALAELKKDPAKALKALGLDPEEFIYGLATEGTPEAAKMREEKRRQAELDELKNWKTEQEKQREEYIRSLETAKVRQHRESVISEFKSLVSEEAAPHARALYTEDQLVSEGDRVAREYRDLTGKEASLKEIAEYLEEQAAKRYTEFARKKSANTAKVPAQVSSGPRTLNTQTSQERRTLSTPVADDLSDEERRMAARAAVSAAIKASESRRKPA